jgi:predicted ATPase
VAQIGSVIGRGFSYGLLRDVAGMEDATLQAALERLAEADILLVQGLPPESDYRFKHALIQDAAYGNLLKSRRQVLHRRVAEILRGRFTSTAVAEPEGSLMIANSEALRTAQEKISRRIFELLGFAPGAHDGPLVPDGPSRVAPIREKSKAAEPS